MNQESLKIEEIPQEESAQLVSLESLKPKEVFTDSGIKNILRMVRESAIPALPSDSPEGREERRKLAYKIARTKTALDGMGKDFVAELKKVSSGVDAHRKTLREALDGVKDEVRKPLTEYEEREAARVAAHNDHISQIRDLMNYDYEPSSKDVEDRIAQVEALFDRDFEEYTDQAKTTYENSAGRLAEKLAATIKAEEAEAELAELRKMKAEKEEEERKAALEKEAEARAAAKVQADLDAAEARAKAAEEKAAEFEAQAETPKPDIPLANPAPRLSPVRKVSSPLEAKRSINQAIVSALVDECMVSESAAKTIVTEIAKGNIPNVQINY